ncbi:MAG: PEP-CTERM sorting domain-containing protein [Phycisphaerae bacterium]
MASVVAAALAGVLVACHPAGAQAPLELWWYDSTNLQSASNVAAIKARIDSAVTAGYSGVVLSDFKLGLYDWDPSLYIPKLQDVESYAAAKGLKVTLASFPFGYSEAILRYDKNLGEGLAVNSATFTVSADGGSLVFNPRTPATQNLGFDAGSGTSITGWSLDSGRAVRDTTTVHSGTASMKIAAGGGRGYGIQTLTVLPYQQLHVSFWVKTSGFSGDLNFKMYDATKGLQRDFTWDNFPNLAATQNWTKYDLVVNTNNSTQLQLRLGSWGGTSGSAWFDDVQVEEVPLHNLVQTPVGSPLKIYRPGGQVLTQGVDVNAITDPNGFVNGAFSTYHTPPTVTINKATSSLKPGDQVKMDYYAVPGPIYNYESGASLIEPGMWAYCDKIIGNIKANSPAGTGVMMGYDEMRQMNTSAGEKALGLTAGQLLAQHVATLSAKLSGSLPNSPLFTWSDMFDPNHNAVNNYYYVDGTIGTSGTIPGSWAGLPRNVTVFNWKRTGTSLNFFAGLGNPQIISGYYDSGSGAAAATAEAAAAAGIPGVRGLMYTTWSNDWSQMAAYAAAARAAWPTIVMGDSNHDNIVDMKDYVNWFNNFGTGTMWEQGDFNGDARVDMADYIQWFNHFGEVGTGSYPAPEPATLAVMAAGAALFLRRRPRKEAKAA